MNLNLLSIIDGTKALEGSEVLQVCILGVGIVFFGLICIVLLCSIMSAVFKCFNKNKEDDADASAALAAAPAVANAQAEPIANKQEFIAAVSAAIAEDMGTDISAIRIKSIKKI